MATKSNSKLEILEVIVERVRSTSEGFSVYSALKDVKPYLIMTVKQFTGPVGFNQRWCIAGNWVDDTRWGKQFVAQFATPGVPKSVHELEDMVAGGLVDGWTWRDLARVKDRLGLDAALIACTKQPYLLGDVPQITELQIAAMAQIMARGAGLAPLYSQLAEWDITGRLADKLIKHYGFSATGRLSEDPYADLLEIDGYGWQSAERIARHLGIPAEDPRRLVAATELAVYEGTWQAGSTWITKHEAIRAAQRLAGTAYDAIEDLIQEAVAKGHIIEQGCTYYPEALYKSEQTIAEQVAMRLDRKGLIDGDRADQLTPDPALSPEQWAAVLMALTNPLSLLTGGPGVGKTTTLRSLISTARQLGCDVTCMAPTGKAAARMAEATAHPATTIHSRLKIIPGQYSDPDDLEPVTGLVVIDEVSMLDTSLAAQMLRRISPGCYLLLVGDPDQLPSVGPGAVLRDLIAVDCLARVHLDKVYRNEAGIAVNAKRIRDGLPIISLDDTPLIAAKTPEHAIEYIGNMVVDLRGAGKQREDILILTPNNDGASGRFQLNAMLQSLLNDTIPGTGIIQYAGSTNDPDGTIHKRQEEIRRNDRVMVTKNSATLGVFNGQCGTVKAVDVPRSITAEIDGQEVVFAGEDRRLLTLAYAVTGHKAQGSEAPIVIVPVFSSRVLCREWLYTVLTRAKERCYLIGDIGAMQACLDVQRASERATGLVGRVRGLLEPFAADPVEGEYDFAWNGQSTVYHARRASVPRLTLCGVDTRDDQWIEGHPDRQRLCLRCQASATTPHVPWP